MSVQQCRDVPALMYALMCQTRVLLSSSEVEDVESTAFPGEVEPAGLLVEVPGGVPEEVSAEAKRRERYFSRKCSKSSQKFGTKSVPMTALMAIP